jgi:hypothetical protein
MIEKNPTTVRPPQIYKTESQLLQKKCEVKLQEHLNHIAGKSRNFLKNGRIIFCEKPIRVAEKNKFLTKNRRVDGI